MHSARTGGTPLFFSKECDSKGVLVPILQEYDSTRLAVGRWTDEPPNFAIDNLTNRPNDRPWRELQKLGAGS